MKLSMFGALLSFLSGVSWAFLLVGAWVTFQSFVFLGIVPALMFTFLFVFLALFLILILETIAIYRERHESQTKQAALLEEIRDMLKGSSSRTGE